MLTELARGRPLIILVNPATTGAITSGILSKRCQESMSAGDSSAGMVYVLPAQPPARVAPSGEQWPVRDRTVNRFEVTLDLGTIRVVRTVGFPLRRHFGELDPRIRIEGSDDRIVWNTLWEGWTGGPALAAALEDPLEANVRLTLPDVRTRYVRVYPADAFLQRDVNVYGPR